MPLLVIHFVRTRNTVQYKRSQNITLMVSEVII